MTHTANNELTSTPGPGFLVGELVDVTIRGARVRGTLADGWISLDVAADFTPSVDTRAAGVTVARVAPPEWPPQPADVWQDRNGKRWAALRGRGGVEMACTGRERSTRDAWADPAEVLDAVGPMRLEYRPGWTRQPDPAPAGPADPYVGTSLEGFVDKRAANVAGLRSLADFLEANPELSEAYGFHGQLNAKDDDHVRELAQRFGTATYEDVANRQFRIDVSFAGGVRFSMVHFRPEPESESVGSVEIEDTENGRRITHADGTSVELIKDPVDEPTQSLQVVIADGGNGPAGLIAVAPRDETDAGDVDDESDDRCTVSSLDGASHRHQCELYGTHPQFDHVCICGQSWHNYAAADQPPIPEQRSNPPFLGDGTPNPSAG